MQKWNYRVTSLENGLDAWSVLRQNDAPQMAILDWMMPGLDGIELCRRIRSHHTVPYKYVLLLTAKGSKEDVVARRIKPIARAAGIRVPVNFQVLRRTFATNAQGFGNPKDVQAHLRHSDIATTFNEYTQTVPESVRKLVNAVTNDVMGSQFGRKVQ